LYKNIEKICIYAKKILPLRQNVISYVEKCNDFIGDGNDNDCLPASRG
jgi:hypothetical protein